MTQDRNASINLTLSELDAARLRMVARARRVSLNGLFQRMVRDFLAGVDEEDTE